MQRFARHEAWIALHDDSGEGGPFAGFCNGGGRVGAGGDGAGDGVGDGAELGGGFGECVGEGEEEEGVRGGCCCGGGGGDLVFGVRVKEVGTEGLGSGYWDI